MNKRTIFWSLLIGMIVGQVLTIWLAPKYLVWYFTPPATIGFDCSAPVGWALTRMRTALFFGIGLGAVGGLVVAWLLRNRLPTDSGPTAFKVRN